MAGQDLYELLGVPRDATPERIRQAYELAMNRAHRDGAHRHAVDLSQAYDTLPIRSVARCTNGMA